MKLLEVLFPLRSGERIVREATYDDAAKLIHPITLAEGVVALLPYRTPLVAALIKEAKFNGNKKAQELLGHVLAEYLQQTLADDGILGADRYVLQPIPLSDKRRRERGYNQAEEIAKVATQKLGLPLADTIYRTRDTLPQTSLKREKRLVNMEQAFAVRETTDATYIVIDDVATTGATLMAAKQILPGSFAIALAH